MAISSDGGASKWHARASLSAATLNTRITLVVSTVKKKIARPNHHHAPPPRPALRRRCARLSRPHYDSLRLGGGGGGGGVTGGRASTGTTAARQCTVRTYPFRAYAAIRTYAGDSFWSLVCAVSFQTVIFAPKICIFVYIEQKKEHFFPVPYRRPTYYYRSIRPTITRRRGPLKFAHHKPLSSTVRSATVTLLTVVDCA